MVFVDHNERGISAAFGVEKDLRGPCFAIVGRTSKGHVRAGTLVVGVREIDGSFSVWVGDKGSHANWFGKRGVVC